MRRLRYSTSVLPQPSMTTSLPAPLEWGTAGWGLTLLTQSHWGLKAPHTVRSSSWPPEELECAQVYGTWWDASQSLEGTVWFSGQATLHNIGKLMAVGWSPRWLEKGKHSTHPLKGQKGGPWEPPLYQPHLCAWGDHRIDPLRGCPKAHGIQGGDLKAVMVSPEQSPAWPTQGPSMMGWPHQWTWEELQMSFLWSSVKPLTWSTTISFCPNQSDGFDEWTVRWIRNRLHDQILRVELLPELS